MKIKNEMNQYISEIRKQVVADRRMFHSFPEVGWTEFRTAYIVSEKLKTFGFDVACGKDVIDASARMGVPEASVLSEHFESACRSLGVEASALAPLEGGFTGVVGTMKFGDGPVVAFRFDMDALKVTESNDEMHIPQKEGFFSQTLGIMHSCGHDGHTAIGLGIAQIISEFKHVFTKGTVKLVFQPAEEGVRGAKSMVSAGVFDDVDYAFASHLMAMMPLGHIVCGTNGFMATTKMDVSFKGAPSHAGASPALGKNAMLAACSAVMNMHAIPRHQSGASRVNVGTLTSGTDRNVIADYALMKIETRGETTEIDDYIRNYALRIIEHAAGMHDVAFNVDFVGGAIGGKSDDELIDLIAEISQTSGCFSGIQRISSESAGSEDFSYMMEAVQARGGKSAYFSIGAKVDENGHGHHTDTFDIHEEALLKSIKVFTDILVAFLI